MLDEIMKKVVLVMHSNKKTFLYPPEKSSNLEGKQYPYEGIL